MQRFISCLAAICAAGAFVACSNSDNGGNHNGSGGAIASGGASQGGSGTATGGSNANGGVTANGGASMGGAASGGAASGGAAMGGAASGGAATGGAANGGSANGGASTAGAANAGSAGQATGGSGGGGNVELKMPIERNGKYVLEFGDVLFEVDPAVGARVITFSFKGTNAITHDASSDVDGHISYGSTFWPSPQSAWAGGKWPPIPEIDNQAYTPSVDGNSIVMTQSMSPSSANKLSVVKRFTPVLNAQAVDVQYTLSNKDSAAASWAPWEITRVPSGGLTFFTTGTNVVQLATSDALAPAGRTMNQGGVTWYKNMSGDKGKYSADCLEGWLAHASSSLLLVKRFMDVPVAQQAPGEGDCEFYAGNGYVELENQGAYGSLPANGSVSWTVRWYIRNLSDPSIATVGNAAIVTMVRDVIKQ